MASGDIITNIADKETLDACYAILKNLRETTISGAVQPIPTKKQIEIII